MTILYRLRYLPYLLAALFLAEGCGPLGNLERTLHTPSSFISAADSLRAAADPDDPPFIKLHMRNGNVFLLNHWSSDQSKHLVAGTGTLYSPMRDSLEAGTYAVGADSILIIETNRLETSGTQVALTIFLGITGAVAAFCATNPKACFGSCPTFYVAALDTLRPRAEGFSASIAPSLEATDCDALGEVPLAASCIAIEMRNEALETHVVRTVDMLAVPRPAGASIVKDDRGSFRACYDLLPPSRATAPEGDCLQALRAADSRERMSRADSTNLAAKETIELAFDRAPGDTCGLVIGCRQSLMTTFLFYKTLGYMGKDAGRWFAEMERTGFTEPMRALEGLLGGIDVLAEDSTGAWTKVGAVLEYGPLATDIHLVPLPRVKAGPVKLRLEMTKGYFRIDNVALARMGAAIEPVRVHPTSVLRDGANDPVALALLLDPSKALSTTPGDSYMLQFDLPGRADGYQLFLESRGYYLEWMRKSWMKEENPISLAEILFNPASALKRLAPEFSRSERAVEEQFWRSKYAH